MTAHYIAKVVQSQFDKINLDEINTEFVGIEKYKYGRMSDEWVNYRIQNKQFYRWMMACGVLETYLRVNYATFEETELVYYWGKQICDMRNKDLNEWRTNGNPFNACPSFSDWLNKKRY